MAVRSIPTDTSQTYAVNEPIASETAHTSTAARPQTPSHELFVGSTAGKLADHHTDLLGLAWRRRSALLASPMLDLVDLAAADDRLLASLGALCALGTPAREHLQALLKEPLRPGDMFVMSLYAFATSDEALFDVCTALQAVLPELGEASLDALRWAPPSPLLETRIEDFPLATRLRMVGLRYRDFDSMAARALDAMRAVKEPGPDDICAALEMLSLMGRNDLAAAARQYLDHGIESVRLTAARTLLALGGADDAVPALAVLSSLAAGDDAAIVESAVRAVALHASQHFSDVMSGIKDSTARRLHIQALGWAGGADAVPVLIGYLDDPGLARIAGASLSLITGSNPARDGWMAARQRRTDPEKTDDGHMPAPDQDNELPWPNADAFCAWWQNTGSWFDRTHRYFLGAPLTVDWLAKVISGGPLAWRPLAAEHWQRLTHGPLFPTHLPAPAQRAIFPELDRRPTS